MSIARSIRRVSVIRNGRSETLLENKKKSSRRKRRRKRAKRVWKDLCKGKRM